MSFTMTMPWLKKYYGSKGSGQEQQAVNWLKTYGVNIPSGPELKQWAAFKHLIEYQVNTPDIIAKALGAIGSQFNDEWQAHKFINLMRVPLAASYEEYLLECKPTSILELGVGGDSAISTAVFIAYLSLLEGEKKILSIDRNPLDTTMQRYQSCQFWQFRQMDSLAILDEEYQKGNRWGVVFIDTIHSYTHTLKELDFAARLTDCILLDDATFEGNTFDPEPGGVKRAIEEWGKINSFWVKRAYHNGAVVSFTKRNSKPKRVRRKKK